MVNSIKEVIEQGVFEDVVEFIPEDGHPRDQVLHFPWMKERVSRRGRISGEQCPPSSVTRPREVFVLGHTRGANDKKG